MSVHEGTPSTSDWIARGYNPKGGLYQMVADLDGSRPLPKVPDDVILRSLRPNEEAEFVQAVNAGFAWEILKPDEVHKWRAEAPYFTEEWIHVAKCDGRIISVVVAKQDVMHNKHFNGNRGYLGPAAILPEYRGKNLASAVTRRAMNFLFEKGMNSVALYT